MEETMAVKKPSYHEHTFLRKKYEKILFSLLLL